MAKHPDAELVEIYENLNNVGALGSRQHYLAAVKKRFPNNPTKLNDAARLLNKIEAYSRFRRPHWKFVRRQISASKVNDVWQVDLAFLHELSRANPKIVLLVVDTLSRRVWLRAIPNKTSAATAAALESVFREAKAYPRIIFSDRGSEFIGAETSRLFSKFKILHFKSVGGYAAKAALAERMIMTFKRKVFKYLSTGRNKSIGPVLEKIAQLMNNTPSRVFKSKFTPEQVYSSPDEKGKLALKWRNDQRAKDLAKEGYPRRFGFDLGDFVRVQEKSHTNPLNRKAFRGIMSRELFTVSKRYGTNPHQYTVMDLEKRPLLERLYSREMIKIASAYE